MRPCLQRDWKREASEAEGKTRTGSRGWTERKAERMGGKGILCGQVV